MTHIYQKQNCRNFKIDAECGQFPSWTNLASSKRIPSLRPEVNILTCSSPTYTRENPNNPEQQLVVHSNLLSLFKYFQSNLWLKIICISLITFRSHFPSIQKSFSLDFQLSQTLEKIIDVCIIFYCIRKYVLSHAQCNLLLKYRLPKCPDAEKKCLSISWSVRSDRSAHTQTVSGLSVAALG